MNSEYGSALSTKLPMPAAYADTSFARDPIVIDGVTPAAATGGIVASPAARLGNLLPIHAGLSLVLSSTAETRGFRVTTGVYGFGALSLLPGPIPHGIVWPSLVQIYAAGVGSAFGTGDLAVAVFVRNTTSTSTNVSTGNYSDRCVDLFKIPAVLL